MERRKRIRSLVAFQAEAYLSKVLKLLVFDLDGTLVDTRIDLGHAVNHGLVHCGYPSLPMESILAFVGDGATLLIERSLKSAMNEPDSFTPPKSRTEKVLSAFLEYYQNHCVSESVLYPGVRNSLEKLRHFRMAVLTNKPLLPTTRILAGLGIAPYFSWVLGGDNDFGVKPNPGALQQILAWAEAGPTESLVIGDGLQDLGVARRAGTHFLGFIGGIGSKQALLSEQPEAILEDMHFLPEAIASLIPPLDESNEPKIPFSQSQP